MIAVADCRGIIIELRQTEAHVFPVLFILGWLEPSLIAPPDSRLCSQPLKHLILCFGFQKLLNTDVAKIALTKQRGDVV